MNRKPWLAIGFVAILTSALANCSERTTALGDDDAELQQLVERVEQLRERVSSTGPVSATMRQDVDLLSAEIERWRSRTGRNDIAVGRGARRLDPKGGATGGVAARIVLDPDGCYKLPPSTYDPVKRELCIMTTCEGGMGLYRCFILPKK